MTKEGAMAVAVKGDNATIGEVREALGVLYDAIRAADDKEMARIQPEAFADRFAPGKVVFLNKEEVKALRSGKTPIFALPVKKATGNDWRREPMEA